MGMKKAAEIPRHLAVLATAVQTPKTSMSAIQHDGTCE